MKKSLIFAGAMLASVLAHAGAADQVTARDPFVRLMPNGAPTSAAFMVLQNAGPADVSLVKAESPVARVVELHTHINDNGVMRMRAVPAIEIKAKGETALKPGGLHIMLIDLKQPLKEGGSVAVTLGFADGSSKVVEAPVVRAGMPAMEQGGHRHHHH